MCVHITDGLAALYFFAFFLTSLTGNTKRGDGTGLEAGKADIFATFFANAVFAIFHALECFLNFGDELALTVTYTKSKSTIRLGSSAVGRVGVGRMTVRHLFQRGVAVALGFDKHLVEQVAEVFNVLRGQRGFLLLGMGMPDGIYDA